MSAALEPLRARLRALVRRTADGSRDDATLDALLEDIAEVQAEAVTAYGRLYARRRPGERPPALPTDVFRFTRVASHPETQDQRVFRTSGTTHGARGEHPFADLSIYDEVAQVAAAHALFVGLSERSEDGAGSSPDIPSRLPPRGEGLDRLDSAEGPHPNPPPQAGERVLGSDCGPRVLDQRSEGEAGAERWGGVPGSNSGPRVLRRVPLISLVPALDEAPDSSLAYMVDLFGRRFGEGVSQVWRDGRLDIRSLESALAEAERGEAPVVVLGTSFAFVHAEEALGERMFRLPVGSRLMQTGGTKGRSREVEPAALRRALAARYGLSEAFVIAEYGMTELSSQLYEDALRRAVRGERERGARRLWVPGWVRVSAVDPETLAPLPEGALGVLRIDDAANLGSVAAIQTADLGRIWPDGVELVGRNPEAVPRGCSLATEEALDAGGRAP